MIPVGIIPLLNRPSDQTFPAASAVTNFNHLSSQYIQANARNTAIEADSTNNPFTYCFWFKGSNLDLQSGRIISIGNNSTSESMFVQVQNGSNLTGEYQRIRFSISGNAGSTIYKRIISGQRVLKNRWYFVCVSDAGQTGTTAANGMEVWINGVKESSPLRQNAGTFVSGVSSASNRLRIGKDGIGGSSYYGGQLRDLSIFNQVLSDAEVLELYNNGEPKSANTVSFWASKGIEYFALTSSVNGLSMTMTNFGTTFTTSIVSALWQGFSFRKSDDTNAKYVAFGNLVPTTQGWAWYGRIGANHLAPEGCFRILPDLYNFAADWDNQTVFSDGTDEFQGTGAGEDDTSIVLLYSRFDGAGFSGPVYRKSTDGKIGVTFNTPVSMAPPTFVTRFNFYEHTQQGFTAGEYFASFYGHNGAGTYRLTVYRTTDNWATWSEILIEQSTNQYGESCILNCGNVGGNNTMILIIRKESSPFGLWQSSSVDGGLTWSTPALTNLALSNTDVCNAGMCINGEGNIDIVYMDRSQKYLLLSRDNDVATVVADETAWNSPSQIFRGYDNDSTYRLLGYPDIKYIGNGRHMITVGSEFSSSRADIFVGFGKLDDL